MFFYMLPEFSYSVPDATEEEGYGERRMCMKGYHSQQDILKDQAEKIFEDFEYPRKKKERGFLILNRIKSLKIWIFQKMQGASLLVY